MTSEVPPEPILATYQYWNWVNVDEATRRKRALDNTYMSFPTAQNYPTSFSKMFVNTISLITQIANTSYVFDRINDLLFGSNAWAGLNTFDSIVTNSMTTNTITATTLALSGTQLDTPMTSTLTYNIIPFTLANGLYTYGTAGQIGYTIVRAGSGGYLSGPGGSLTSYRELSNISLTQGVWLLSAEVSSTDTNTQTTGIGFNTTANTFAGGFGYRGITRSTNTVMTVQPFVQLSSSAVYYASGAVTMRLHMATEGFGLTPGKHYLTAVRIA